ncbi:hypothetical protein QCA50_008225 [Cerrena zonata]|uniref:Uncharacterized protein n=1 Tax=Cerrena zonata TaxID=2478898 RepID=A0AAW0G8D8_9APHY
MPLIFSYIVDLSCLIAYATLDCVRIWSICQHEWAPTLLVFVLSMFDPVVNIYVKIAQYASTTILIPSGPLAGCWGSPHIVPYVYAFDYQGNICSCRCCSDWSDFMENNALFNLDLRCIHHQINDGSESSSSRHSSLHFASAIEGNMGATLSSPWADEEGDGDEIEGNIQYSEYPFSAGLATIKDNVITADASELPEAGTTAGMTEEIELSHIV